MTDTSTAERDTGAPRGARRPKRGRKARRSPWTWAFPATIVALALAIPAFVWYAADAIITSADGTVKEAVTDPGAPGYQASVIPSPSHLLLVENPDGDLTLAGVMSTGADGDGGTLVLLPAGTVAPDGKRLVDHFDDDGSSGTTDAIEDLLGVRVDDTSTLDDDAWATLVAPVGDVELALNERLTAVEDDGTTTVGWEAGTAEVPPEMAAAFLSWRNPGEDAFNRVLRQEHYFDAWLAAIAASEDPGVVPGEIDSGLGQFIRAISVRPVVLTPSLTTVIASGDTEGLAVDRDELSEIVYNMIPFPVPAADNAPRVRLLDGTGETDLASEIAPALVRQGAQIVIIGNANEFPISETSVIYHSGNHEESATAFAEALGVGETTLTPLEDSAIDITVIVGEDRS